ncbi:peptidase domain-containing ABC transporter [Pedobacter gandavensis]|uniref:ATP-binding cassette domain-containing protein n=1 Tax=Pedobacter gandavensis TaxID=2679963 RepID=A0ABR6EST6_9SPHI|nr:peptidase domain-containing ABC transporter [Pedobacter gandavensis]MBB2148325.1 ATP-binding cassette domain-containing protein [Pedobacter gandavensis]
MDDNLSKLRRKTFKRQQERTDCGIACLISITKFHGGHQTVENLREISGTNTQGTTLLGLYQCAEKIGFDANAFTADLTHLELETSPLILHVVMEKTIQHFVIYYGKNPATGQFIIGDPAKGIYELDAQELTNIWKSKALLKLSPNSQFTIVKDKEKAKVKWFKNLIYEDINILLTTMALGLVITILGFSTAIFSQKLIDVIIPGGDTKKLIFSLTLLALAILLKSALTYVRQYLSLLQNRDFSHRIIRNFFSALVYLPKQFFDTRSTGDMITRMNDTSRIQQNVAFITGTVFIDIVVVITTALFLINYSQLISMITFCFIPVIIWLITSYTKPIKTFQKNLMVAQATNQSNYIDTIQGIEIIKSQNEEMFFIEKVNLTYGGLQLKTFDLGRLGNRFKFSTEVITMLLSTTIMSVSAYQVMQKKIELGEMIAIIALSNILIQAVGRLSQVNLQLQEAKVAFDRMYDFASILPEYNPKDRATEIMFNQLEVCDLTFGFPGRGPTLKNINFEVKKGEIITLLGESGCGKSTTIALLQQFYKPTQGIILVNKKNLDEFDTPSWRETLATVPQEIKLFNGSLLDNIAISDTLKKSGSIIEFCKETGLDEFFSRLPQGYHTLVGEEGINLSGGQKQLVALARALYRNPQILLLDEATSAMDRRTEKFIIELLLKYKEKMAIIMVTHKVMTAKIADRIYIIEHGIIRDGGTPVELLSRDNFFSQMILEHTI